MKRNSEDFKKILEKQMKKNKRSAHSNIGYGEDVMPILELYNSISDFDESKAFREAIASFLADSDSDKRSFAIDVCLGFLVFRDAIGH